VKKFAYFGAPLVLFLGFLHPAQAGCTAQLTCQPACNLDVFCPRQYQLCREVSCSWPGTVINCSGNTTCTVGSGSVTCDGTVVHCPPLFICKATSGYVQCGNEFQSCADPCPQ
jgi:hypothetical protein